MAGGVSQPGQNWFWTNTIISGLWKCGTTYTKILQNLCVDITKVTTLKTFCNVNLESMYDQVRLAISETCKVMSQLSDSYM